MKCAGRFPWPFSNTRDRFLFDMSRLSFTLHVRRLGWANASMHIKDRSIIVSFFKNDNDLDIDILGLEAAYLPCVLPAGLLDGDDLPGYSEPDELRLAESTLSADGDEFPADFSIRIEAD